MAAFLAGPSPFKLCGRRVLVWGALLLVLAAVLAFVPLLDTLAYEFAFVMALAASFATADVAAAFVARLHGGARSAAPPGRAVAELWLSSATTGLALLVPPLALMSANALRVRQCDWTAGLTFSVLLSGLSAAIAAAVGVGCGLVMGARPRRAVVAAWIFVVASLVIGIGRFIAAPPIFAYDPFAGYFPGALYDEEVALGTAFAWARVYQAAFAVATLAALAAFLAPDRFALSRRRPAAAPAAVSALAAVLAIAIFAHSGELGFAVSAADIQRGLGGRLETPHFVIIYPLGAAFAPPMEAIAAEHELRYAQVARAFGVEPAGKITSYYFASAGEKKRWMGAGSTYIAKPWRREIYIQHDDFPHPTLRHEIAHVFAGAFGDPLFHVSVAWWGWPPARFNVGMIEGAAVAADWPGGDGRATPDQAARAMLDAGTLPPLAALLTTGFLTFSAAQSYTAAGSFVHYLLVNYGPSRLRAAYRAGGSPASLAAIYGRTLPALEAEWRREIAGVPLPDGEREAARERLRRPSIFHRPCAHAVARRTAAAAALSARGATSEAAELLSRVCADDPGEPTHELALAGALERAGRAADALALYDKLAGETSRLSSPLRARALSAAADLAARGGDLAAAGARVERALTLAVDEPARRSLIVRRAAFADDTPGAKAVRLYLAERGRDGRDPPATVRLLRAQAVAAALPESGLGHYLEGRVLIGQDAYADAAPRLEEAARLGLTDPLLARENDRMLAGAAFLAGDLAGARAAASRLAEASQPPAIRLEGKDWLERCEFAATGRLPSPAPPDLTSR